MTDRRRLLGALAGLSLLVLAVEPAAAQGYSSLNEQLIRGLNLQLLYVAIPIAVLVEGILIYTVWEFKDNDDPQPTQENRRLEITWTVATAVILLFVGFASFQVLGAPAVGGVTASDGAERPAQTTMYDGQGAVGPKPGEDAMQVEVVAQKYSWTFNYLGETVNGNESRYVTTTGTLVIPTNETVYLHVTSRDWLHALHVPALGLKQDAFPGKYNTIKTVVYEPGSYQLYCAEYCGVGHSGMLGEVRVLPQAENPADPAEGTYEYWVQQQKDEMTQSTNSSSIAPA